MRTLVFVTQVVDPDDPLLGFVCGKVRALARRCDRVIVIANEVRRVPEDLGADVVSLGKERGAGRLRKGLRYCLSVARAARSSRPDAIVAHMCPVYLNLAAPFAKVAGVPTVLWYVHPGVDAGLRLAARLADGIATCYPGSFPLRVGSVRAIGHGIDVGAFAGVPPPADGRFRLLVLGRTSPEKGIPTALRAWAKVRGDTELRIVGPAPMPGDRLHRAELARMLADLDPTGDARLEDGVPPSRVPDLLAWADVLVSPMVAGSGDKVVFEAMAAGRVVVASNPVFGPLLDRHGLRFAPDDDRALATLLERLASTPRSDRAAVGADLRAAVRREHSLDSWADGMLSLVGDLRGTR